MTGDDLRALSSALGQDPIREHAPLQLDGASLGYTLAPSSGESLSGIVRVLGGRRLAAVVRGAGSRLDLGNPPARADAILSTDRLCGIEVLDAEEGVLCARAGTPLDRLREEARAAGWELPLDPPGPGSTLGGTLAAAALGPRCLGFGRPRDLVLGLQVVLGSGERTRSGGRVVKNVTGYDLQRLYTGSLGTLAVIESAWLRLRPLPERTELLSAPFPSAEKALASAAELRRGHALRALAVVDATLAASLTQAAAGTAWLLVAELAGDAAVVEAERARLRDQIGARSTSAETLDRIRSLQGEPPGPAAMRVRLDALPTRVARAAEHLRGTGGSLLVYPGLGLVYGRFVLGGPGGADAGAILAAVREAALTASGGYVLEAAPLEVKRGTDVFGEAPPAVALMRTLKQHFDPCAVLNPGRFVGGI